MKVKEFLTNLKLRGNVDIAEIKTNSLNPDVNPFIISNPYKIDHIENFDFKHYYARHELLRKYANMEIISINVGNCDGRCSLTIGCINKEDNYAKNYSI